MRLENSYATNQDLRFYYEQVIDWQRLAPMYGEAAQSWREVLEVAGDYIGKQVAGRAAEIDRLGTPHTGEITVSPPMAETLRGLADLGLTGLGIPTEYGGAGGIHPFVVQAAVFEM